MKTKLAPIIGLCMAVVCLPGDPSSAIIEGGSTDFAGMEWLGYVVGAISLVWAYYAFVLRPTRTPKMA